MRSKTHLIALASLLFLAGCAPYAIKRQDGLDREANKFVVIDRFAYKRLLLVSAEAKRTPDGRFDLAFKVRNKKNKNVWLDVKVQWLDDKGQTIEETEWRATQFHRRMDTAVKFASIRALVADYRVLIRRRIKVEYSAD